MSHDCSGDDPSRAVLAVVTDSLVKEKSHVDDRLGKLQGQEWLVVGGVSSPVRTETKTTPGDNDEGLDRRVLAGAVDSSMKMEDHHPEDRSDKPEKHELLALRMYGSSSWAKTDEFFADTDELLSGKTE